jgi:hypothetical protein
VEEDLKNKTSRFTWVVQHWHMLNRGAEVWVPMSPGDLPRKPRRGHVSPW